MSKVALYQKIVKVMEQIGQLQKDGNVIDGNGKKMYAYLSEEQTTGELQRAFVQNGLVLFPVKVESELIYLKTVKFEKVVEAPITKVLVTYKICDAETGESEELQSIGYGSDSQDKGSNKAMTGAFKYVQRQTFMISTGDDGDHTGSEELDKQYTRPAAAQQTQQGNSNVTPMKTQTPATAQAGQPGEGPTEGQRKMLYAKHQQSLLKGSFERISDHLGYPVTKFDEVKKSDVNKLIALLDENKAS